MSLFRAAAGLAGLLHLIFFVLESVLWSQPRVQAIFKVETVEVAAILERSMFNQGVYNLALGLGALGAAFFASSSTHGRAARAIGAYCCAFMVLAALALFVSAPGMIRGVLIQGLAPTVALVGLWRASRVS